MSVPQPGFTLDKLVGKSDVLARALNNARRVSQAPLSTVLLIGETGTGKELFARGIHCEGLNSAAPFVAINCAAIPEALLESELFGHEAGAFTGATVRKAGLMELAGTGTLFLDEIHQLPMQAQPKLLRALEERMVRRVGGTQEIAIECRIIAASNVSIEGAVDDGTFRADLFYRLNVLRIDIPPLRDRHGDVEILARHFLHEMAREHSRAEKELTPSALAALAEHAWRGNVRELKNVIERATVLSGAARQIEPAHLCIQRRAPRMVASSTTAAGEIEVPVTGKTMREIEREAASLTMKAANGNQSLAAKMLGISRPTLARILREAEPERGIRLIDAS